MDRFNSLKNEIFVHGEFAKKLNHFIPKFSYCDDKCIIVDYINGISLREILKNETEENISKYISSILKSLIITHNLTKKGEVRNKKYEI